MAEETASAAADDTSTTDAATPPPPAATGSMPSKAMWPFIIISITYLLFTVTDGAVRMLVLLHAYNKGFTAMEVAIMFTLYEVMGRGLE
jgi:hypothetical protein